MSLEIEPIGRPKRKVGKYHFFTMSNPDHDALLKELREYYRPNEDGESPEIEPDHVRALLLVYSTDKRCQLLNFAETFSCSMTTLYSLLMREDLLPDYKAACKARSETFQAEAVECASVPYDKIMEGEDVSPMLVRAAQLKSNVLMTAAEHVNPENKSNGSGSTPVHINVSAPFQLGGYFGKEEKADGLSGAS